MIHAYQSITQAREAEGKPFTNISVKDIKESGEYIPVTIHKRSYSGEQKQRKHKPSEQVFWIPNNYIGVK